jgi:hypothetical protein
VKENLDKNWCWLTLSTHINMTLDIIKSNSDKPWHPAALSGNPNITWEFFQEFVVKGCAWTFVSMNPMEEHLLVKKRLEKESRERSIARCKAVKEEMMMFYWHPDRYDKWCFDDAE